MDSAIVVQLELHALANPAKAKILRGFFKTGKGDYGEGDVFLGISVPQTRAIAKKHQTLSQSEIRKLLQSPVHEERLCALEILVMQFESGDEGERKRAFRFFMKHAKKANNWDLVDLSAPYLVGEYLADKGRKVLYKLARSKDLWERRISIVSTYAFIKRGEFRDTFAIAKLLLDDSHDLTHKACGWMLRECGKKDKKALEGFFRSHARKMPRTMLRYAIEKFSEKERKKWLAAKA